MIIPNEVNDAFFSGQRSEKIKYIINDTVLVTQGSYKGKEGAVISIEKTEPEVIYIVEVLDGTGDIVVPQNSLELVIASEVGKKMRQYALVKLTENFKKSMENKKEHPIMQEDVFIYFGEIPNMLGHCVVSGHKSGKVFSGYHIDNFRELTVEEL